jgi:hypothetical protein
MKRDRRQCLCSPRHSIARKEVRSAVGLDSAFRAPLTRQTLIRAKTEGAAETLVLGSARFERAERQVRRRPTLKHGLTRWRKGHCKMGDSCWRGTFPFCQSQVNYELLRSSSASARSKGKLDGTVYPRRGETGEAPLDMSLFPLILVAFYLGGPAKQTHVPCSAPLRPLLRPPSLLQPRLPHANRRLQFEVTKDETRHIIESAG